MISGIWITFSSLTVSNSTYSRRKLMSHFCFLLERGQHILLTTTCDAYTDFPSCHRYVIFHELFFGVTQFMVGSASLSRSVVHRTLITFSTTVVQLLRTQALYRSDRRIITILLSTGLGVLAVFGVRYTTKSGTIHTNIDV